MDNYEKIFEGGIKLTKSSTQMSRKLSSRRSYFFSTPLPTNIIVCAASSGCKVETSEN